jgi:hypothetical protein
LYIYNVANELINQTTVALDGAVEATVGIVVSLADGVYTWFYGVFDMAGNYFATGNWTLTVDTNRSLVGWWKGDNNANDSSGNGNNGTLNGDVTYTAGKIGNAFSFDGNGDYVSTPLVYSYPQITLGAWINPTVSANTQWIVGDWEAGGTGSSAALDYDEVDSDKIRFSIMVGGTEYSLRSNALLSLDTWYHVFGVYNGTDMVLYIDGSLDNNTSVSGSLDAASAVMRIGGMCNGCGTNYFAGKIDDVHIYSYALNASEILALYNNASDITAPAINFTSPTPANGATVTNSYFNVSMTTSDNNAEHYAFLNFDNSLVGWWKGEDNANDTLGINNGTFNGDANASVTGRFGNAFGFDGDGDYVSIPYSSSLNITNVATFSVWVKPAYTDYGGTPTAAFICGHGGWSNRGWSLGAAHGDWQNVRFHWQPGIDNPAYILDTTSNPLSTGVWTHVVGVANGTYVKIYINGQFAVEKPNSEGVDYDYPIEIGRCGMSSPDSYFNGSIDEVLIFNRSLSASEVASLYNATANQYNNNFTNLNNGNYIIKGYAVDTSGNVNNTETRTITINIANRLVGWWKGDGDATDSSGFGNNGTWSGTENYTTGRIGQAFHLDGSGYVNMSIDSYPTGDRLSSEFLWFRTTSNNPWLALFNHGPLSQGNRRAMAINATPYGSIYFGGYYDDLYVSEEYTAEMNYSDGNWHFIGYVYRGSGDIDIYFDGVSYPHSSLGLMSLNTLAGDHFLGRMPDGGDTNNFTGDIDDYRIYNYALNGSEVLALYNNVSDTTAPLINFTSPTPSDGETINASYFNVSLNTSDNNYDHYAFLNFDNSLKGWWRGENNTGDDSGNENNGTLNGGTTYISGKFGNAFSFDDSDDYISVNSAGDLPDGNNQFTFSLWAYPESFVTGTALSLAEDGSGTNRMALGFTGNGASGTWNYYDPALAEWVPSASGAVMIDTWQMVTITFDGTTDRYYINGSEIGSRVASHTFNSSYTFIGTDNQGDPFNGSIDDVLIFNRSLSASEVASLYNATANQYNNNFTNLSNGAHTIKGYAVDSSGNVNNTETRTITVNVTFVNLTINSVTTSPLNPKDIQNISVIVNVSSDVTGGGVTCNLTGELGEYQGNASAGINKNVTFRIGTQTVGDHYYNVSCSSSGETADSLNNLVYVANTPNLYISNVTFSASNPSPGQPIIVYAMVGSYYASSENLVVAFYEDGVNIENTTISSISADSLAETFIYKTFSSDGNHIISVEVNPASSIVETNYTDNSFTKGISVGDAAYGDISVNLTLTPNPVNYSSTFSVNGSVIYDFSPYVSVKSGVVILVYQGDGVNANRTYSTTTNENGVFSFTGLLANNTAGNYIVTVTVSDGTFVGTDTTTITIAPSAISPYPDLMFDGSSDITFNDSVAVINESIRITANVKNRGGANSSAVVHFYDGNIFIGESNITNVVNGSSATASVNYTFDSYGTHSVKAAVDPQNFVQEASETNNNITRTMRVYYNASDLDPYRITTSEDSPLVGQSVSLTAYVYNIEGVIATNIPVNFYANGVLIGQNNISYINPAYNVGTTNISYAFASSGVYNITVAVNEQQTLSESSYSNNNHTSNSLVTAYDSYTNDLFVNDLYTNNTFADGTANLIASVKNLDNGNISDVIVVDFYVNGTFVGAANTTGLNSGQTKNISLPYSFSKNYLGTINFTAIANQERSITETSYANNNRSELFRVYMPDLRVLGPDIIFSQNGVNVEGATLGTDVTINVTITNLNNSDAKNVNIVINSTGGFSDNILVNVSALSSATVSTTWNSISPVGSAVVSVYANSNYSSFEARTSNNYATRSLNVFGSAPQIELLGAPNEDQVVSGSFEVDVSQTNATNIVYTLYYENGTQVNSATYDSSETNHTFNLTGLANGNYSYIANATVFGAYNATGLRNITVIGSCLSQCTEGNGCTISEDCMLNDNICSDNTCEFENLTLSAKIYTLYDSSGNGKNLTLNLTSNETGSSIMFLPGNSIIFSGRAGTDLGVGSAAGSAGILNITVYDLFNTTRAMFIGQGGYTTSADAAGGNGGQVQLNYHGLIRKFTDATGFYLCGLDEWGDPAYCPDNTPSLTRGSAIVGLAGNAGNISYVKSLDCNPERDSDADNDGVVFASDLFDLSYYNAVNGSAYYSQAYDIACKNKLNVVAMSRVGLEYDRGRI